MSSEFPGWITFVHPTETLLCYCVFARVRLSIDGRVTPKRYCPYFDETWRRIHFGADPNPEADPGIFLTVTNFSMLGKYIIAPFLHHFYHSFFDNFTFIDECPILLTTIKTFHNHVPLAPALIVEV